MSSFKSEERASQSGSEDGNYPLYGDLPKQEDLDDDPNSALTSQTLNADGTPKRPMNAFMIFARRRRPQVSAENQAMRTGEISKILSKEWVTMPSSEKQFYLEQAKQLKETFNTRYPDYVYRRRPNNTRRRRRSEPGTARPADQMSADGDDGLDFDASPIDGDEHSETGLPQTSHSRPSYSMGPNSLPPLDQVKYGGYSRNSSHQVGDSMFGSNGQHRHDARLNQYSVADRLSNNMGPPTSTSPRMQVGSDGLYPYVQTTGQSQSPSSIFGTDASWQTRVDRTSSSWLGNSQDRLPSSLSGQKPYSSGSSWPNNEGSSGHSHHSPSSPNFFPTLNSPFYPNQTQLAPFQSNLASTSSPLPHHQTPSFDAHGSLPSNSMSRNFTPRGYDASISPGGSYPPISPLEAAPYSQRSRQSMHANAGYPVIPQQSSGHDGLHGNGDFWRNE